MDCQIPMLEIKDIRKQYVTGDLVQTALDGVSLTLRKNEFVAILGPSGSGKTTLLNVIGGLDRYDSGDLVINGISTRKYTDRDWDSYRNHTIGFVFQSYNLIPHQTVLANVELALTISGISRAQRRKRAKKALEDVGLGNQLHKKPNQMSGGQMQRVAIARALVNDPDILLADEPTGALDSDTSVQVMELLKEVSRDRLVVMVTHNPELAEEYANRIVRVRDGRIIDDTNPCQPKEDALPPQHKNMGKASMSFLTALALSFNNLRTKKARTLLTAFAGSIGIIGIALILSLSTGFQRYIDQIQEDTLSNYPLTIQSETADMTSMMMAMGTAFSGGSDTGDGTVLEQQMIASMFAQFGANDLESFKTYLDENYSQVENIISSVQYSYGIKPVIFSGDTDRNILQVNPGSLFTKLTGGSFMPAYMNTDVFQELPDIRMLKSQYDVLRGRWPESYDELVIVLTDPSHIPDYISYSLGLRDMAELDELFSLVMQGKDAVLDTKPMNWSYEELMALDFRLVSASSLYRYNGEYNVWEDMSGDKAYMKTLIGEAQRLPIVGIITPKAGASTAPVSTGIGYTAGLTQYVISEAADDTIVQDQLANEAVNVFTGQEFNAQNESSLNFEDMISVDGEMLSNAFGMDIDTDRILSLMENYMGNIMEDMTEDVELAQQAFTDGFTQLSTGMLTDYIQKNADPETGKARLRLLDAQSVVSDYLTGEQAHSVMEPLAKTYSLPADTLQSVYEPLLLALVSGVIAENMEVPEVTPDLPPETTEEATEATAATEAAEATESTEATQPGVLSEVTIDPESLAAWIDAEAAEAAVNAFSQGPVIKAASGAMAGKMVEVMAREKLMKKLSGFGNYLMKYMGSSITVDEEMISSAFQFNMNEEELRRLMDALSGSSRETNAASNLSALGYARLEAPTMMSFYFKDFAGKETFMDFLDGYNEQMEASGKEEQIINYTDVTGVMMSSVRTIIDSVSYVLIAFVAVSLVVSSIMIGIITYISVMERTKEIGILRAIGASKRNISQVFNAETFIIGLCSGLMGVGITLLLILPINEIIHTATNSTDISAQLPAGAAVILILLSMGLTLIGGLIPSRKAAKKDPVIALRSE